jgi:hypothetical protein
VVCQQFAQPPVLSLLLRAGLFQISSFKAESNVPIVPQRPRYVTKASQFTEMPLMRNTSMDATFEERPEGIICEERDTAVGLMMSKKGIQGTHLPCCRCRLQRMPLIHVTETSDTEDEIAVSTQVISRTLHYKADFNELEGKSHLIL